MGFKFRKYSRQTIQVRKNPIDNKILYLDYFITLPPRSLNEFLFWLQGYGSCVEVIYPESLQKKHKKSAIELSQRYNS